jgi:small subunit ribosomal protein S4|uniref:Small ribosomal subunit protein uS4c n=1 Tax=Cyanidioschyzon merolae TaxID=45157 RepID=A0A5P9RV07_CYAME|nr:ribosomal protein S4 [Cyanidioschyzon merolae strain 10D]QFV16923.1 30S ribosomal protein S4 [Cyanidioschyzon merolae]QFV17102.1 30S ribosomal protein S4 [Cyanidioschyzon merolae]BAC76103.1 30S ribosomal protein S4 [Cyanidioschyzon merolae strain 10D]
MSRYLGPRVRIIRRLGILPAFTNKSPNKRTGVPGEHAHKTRKLSEYAVQLQEKQKLQYYYGITNNQLARYFRQAKKSRASTGIELLKMLETRLDHVVYRAGFAPTLPAARQLVNHGHVKVNGNQVTIASFACQVNHIIEVKAKSPSSAQLPPYLQVENQFVKMIQPVEKDWLAFRVNELLVVEYYTRVGA